ncbi:MAG: hypothetical protein LBD45_06145 [Bacteroidales bacterium]|nr:hypothetical protein [Bacteroidales bacterium]
MTAQPWVNYNESFRQTLNERCVVSRVLLAGGNWNNATNCGSRARNANNSRANANANIGGQGRRHRGGAYAYSTAGYIALSSCLSQPAKYEKEGLHC